MTTHSSVYLERLLDDVDRVTEGRQNAISADKWLVNNYDPDMMRLVAPFLSFKDQRVIAEVVILFSNVRERGVMKEIEGLTGYGDSVSMARLGYLTAMKEDDEAIPELIDILEHKRGQEFTMAARRIATIGRASDIPAIRKIYGQVGGTMQDDIRYALERVIARNPDLQPRADLILSIPVYPNETEFEGFLDRSIDYLDSKYRANVFGKRQISSKAHANVVRALRLMRTRLYNEYDNLSVYGPDKEDRYQELVDLVKWASDDLSTKEVVGPDSRRSRVCPRCGGMLTCYKGIWMCPECGGNL